MTLPERRFFTVILRAVMAHDGQLMSG